MCSINPALHIPRDVLESVTPGTPLPPKLVKINSYRRFRHHFFVWFPSEIWWFLDLTGVHRAWTRSITRARRAGHVVQLVYGADDYSLFKLRERAWWSIRREVRSGALDFVSIPGADHALMGSAGRERTLSEIVRFLTAQFQPTAGLSSDQNVSAEIQADRIVRG